MRNRISTTTEANLNQSLHLRNLPAIDEIVRSAELAELRETCTHQHLVTWARAAVDHYRAELRSGVFLAAGSILETITAHVLQSHRIDCLQSMQHVINGTGVLLHTNLGRAPLAAKAQQRMREAAAYTNLEMELVSGKRSRRGARASELLTQLTGAEDAVVVNNCAAATILVLQAIARDREVVISRGQLIEIGGGFRLPEVFVAAGVTLHEIGTTNRTYLRDYEQALNAQTGAIIRVHRSNFSQTGFVTEPNIEELVTIKRPAEVPVIDDIGSGCVVDLAAHGIHEPTVMQSVRAGADLCLFSGDKLFGGPQCGIVVGKARWIDRLRSHPLMRALRADKITLAALEATTEIHLAGQSFEHLPLYQMLARSPEWFESKSEWLLQTLREWTNGTLQPTTCHSQIGGGSLPGVELPSVGVSIHCASPEDFAARLRMGSPAVQSRVVDERVLIDLRTVQDDEWDALARRLRESLTATAGAQSS